MTPAIFVCATQDHPSLHKQLKPLLELEKYVTKAGVERIAIEGTVTPHIILPRFGGHNSPRPFPGGLRPRYRHEEGRRPCEPAQSLLQQPGKVPPPTCVRVLSEKLSACGCGGSGSLRTRLRSTCATAAGRPTLAAKRSAPTWVDPLVPVLKVPPPRRPSHSCQSTH